jgi:hypothetical protein
LSPSTDPHADPRGGVWVGELRHDRVELRASLRGRRRFGSATRPF